MWMESDITFLYLLSNCFLFLFFCGSIIFACLFEFFSAIYFKLQYQQENTDL